MKKLLFSSFVASLVFLSQTSCNREDIATPDTKKSGARAGLSFHQEGSNSSSGYYAYPARSLDFTNTCNGSAVNLLFTPQDVPNRFIVRDNTGTIVAQSGQQSNTSGHNGYIGTTNNSGPWGGPFSTGGSENASFTYDASKTYTLSVETTVQYVTDSWSVDYTTNSCDGSTPTACNGKCGQTFTGSRNSNGFYVYPAVTLNLSNNCPGSAVYILLTPQDVPNRFTIKDSNGTTVAQSGQQSNTTGHNGFIGTTNNQGPWGSPFSTGGSEYINFTYDATKTYTLTVETVVQDNTDSWEVDIHCPNG